MQDALSAALGSALPLPLRIASRFPFLLRRLVSSVVTSPGLGGIHPAEGTNQTFYKPVVLLHMMLELWSLCIA